MTMRLPPPRPQFPRAIWYRVSNTTATTSSTTVVTRSHHFGCRIFAKTPFSPARPHVRYLAFTEHARRSYLPKTTPSSQPPTTPPSALHHDTSLTTVRNYSSMSDADYEAFLNKANAGSGGDVQEQSKKSYGTQSVNTSVPKVLEGVQEYYSSDADEPFEPVALNFDGGGDGIDAQQLGTLLSHGGAVTQLSVDEWDPKGQYKAIVSAVKKAVAEAHSGAENKDDIKVFKVELEGTRAEYYVVGVVEGKVVGLKALSVES